MKAKGIIGKGMEALRKRKALVMGLAAAVVFITTYTLILPAMTLDEQSAQKQGGIDLPAATEQAKAGQAADSNAKLDAAEEDADAGNSKKNKAGDVKAEESDGKAEASELENDPVEDAQATSAGGTLKADGKGYSVSAMYDAYAEIPEDTELTAKEILAKDEDYDTMRDLALATLQKKDGKSKAADLKFSRFFDITMTSDGSEVEPAAPVDVTISYDKAIAAEKRDRVRIVHFIKDEKTGKLKAEVLDSKKVEPKIEKKKMTETAFEAESFSVYGIVYTLQTKVEALNAIGDDYEVTVTYGEDAKIPEGAELKVKALQPKDSEYRQFQADVKRSKVKNLGDIPTEPALFDISILSDGQEIEPAEGSEVKVEVKLTGETVQGMFTGEEAPLLVNDAPITEEMGKVRQSLQVIHQVDEGQLDVMDTKDTISGNEVTTAFSTGSFSDWLLFLDETVDNITIGRNDTLTLRPYSKWVWKRVAEEEQYQGYEWKVPSNSNVISFTKADKTDDQLNETYTYYHGRANNTGSFDLQLTDNGTVVKTIHVTVVDDVPDTPPTIQGTDEIAVNLFDYDINTTDRTKSGGLDKQSNVASSYDASSVNKNTYSDLKFLGYGGSNSNSEWFTINNYTKDVPNQDILERRLDNGYPKLGKSEYGNTRARPSLKYLFDTTSRNNDVYAYPNLTGLFQKDTEGYYYYNSNSNYAYYNPNGSGSQITLYEHTYSQWTQGSAGPNAKPIGFFPFHQYDSYLKEGNVGMNFNTNLNHHFGMSMAVDFEIPSDGLDDYGNPITFEFSGDDDMWVFIDDNLVLDVGGIHQPVTGSIDFSADKVSVYGVPDTTITKRFQEAGSPKAWEIGDGKPHTMKVFYLERGGCDSNLSLRFNTPKRFGKGKLALVKRENNKNTPLKGAKFKIWDNAKCEGEPIGEYTSDDDGKIDFGEFLLKSAADTYYLKETKGPDGYVRDTAVYQIRPRTNVNGVVKDASGDYIILDVFNEDGTPLTKLENDSVVFPNSKIGSIDIPVKKTWVGPPTDTASVELTIKRYKLIDKTKGFVIIKELSGEPEDYAFDAEYKITYPDGHAETVPYSDFQSGTYSLPDAEPGDYVIEETVKSDAPDGYTIEHSTQRQEVTLEEDGTAQVLFRTTLEREKGELYIKANITVQNGSASDIDYSKVRYAVLDANGKKVTSITHAQAVAGTKLDLPTGTYTVKAVSVPRTPATYSLTEQKFNETEGEILRNISVTAGDRTESVYKATYVKKNNAQNCTWKIKDQWAHYGQEITYKSGNVNYPAGTKLRMSFQVPQGKSELHTVTYDGQTLTGAKSNVQDKEEYSVEFTVKDNAQLVYSINVFYTKQIDITGPTFEIVGTENNRASAARKQASAPKNAAKANAGSVEETNTAKHPAAPTGKKYVKDPEWSETVTLDKDNNWQDLDTLKGLPAADEEGNSYYYYVAAVSESGLAEGTACSIDLDGENQLLIGKDLNGDQTLGVTNQLPGGLKVTKDLLGDITGNEDKAFKVTIRNSSGKYLQSDMTSFGDTAYEFTLSKSTPLEIPILPIDTYTVTEKTDSGDIEITGFIWNELESTFESSVQLEPGETKTVELKNCYNREYTPEPSDTNEYEDLKVDKDWVKADGTTVPAQDDQIKVKISVKSAEAYIPVMWNLYDGNVSGENAAKNPLSGTYYVAPGSDVAFTLSRYSNVDRDHMFIRQNCNIQLYTESGTPLWLKHKVPSNQVESTGGLGPNTPVTYTARDIQPGQSVEYSLQPYLSDGVWIEGTPAKAGQWNLDVAVDGEKYDTLAAMREALIDNADENDLTVEQLVYTMDSSGLNLVENETTCSVRPAVQGTGMDLETWIATLKNLPAYLKVNEGGVTKYRVYEYEVSEIEVDHKTVKDGKTEDYIVTITPPAAGSNPTKITNTEIKKVDLDAEKEWIDADGNTMTPPEGASVTFELFEDRHDGSGSKATGKQVVLDGKTVTQEVAEIRADDSKTEEQKTALIAELEALKFGELSTPWKAEWKDLPQYSDEEQTQKITYTVKEVSAYEGFINQDPNGVSAEAEERIIRNKQDTADVEILKVDKDSKNPLPGASFSIRKIKVSNATSGIEYDGSEQPGDPETTGSDGKTSFRKIPAGMYEIKETKIPAGYVINGDDVFYIRIENSGVQLLKKTVEEDAVTFTEAEENEKVGNVTLSKAGSTVTLTVENEPGVELPSSGGCGTTWIYLLGAILLLGGGILLAARRRIAQ